MKEIKPPVPWPRAEPVWARDVPIPDPPHGSAREREELESDLRSPIAVPDDGGAHARELVAAQKRPMTPLQLKLYAAGAARLQVFRRWVGGLWWKPIRFSACRWHPAHEASVFDLLNMIPFVALEIAPTLLVIKTPRGTLEHWPREHRAPLPVARVVVPSE